MKYITQAQDLMKVETIVNCWQKMSILPIINNDDMQ